MGRAKKEFTQPPISDDDDGDLAYAIAADPEAKVVKILFGRPVLWIAFEADTAEAFANLILDKVRELKASAAPPPQE